MNRERRSEQLDGLPVVTSSTTERRPSTSDASSVAARAATRRPAPAVDDVSQGPRRRAFFGIELVCAACGAKLIGARLKSQRRKCRERGGALVSCSTKCAAIVRATVKKLAPVVVYRCCECGDPIGALPRASKAQREAPRRCKPCSMSDNSNARKASVLQ